MICQNCQKEIKDSSKFCNFCGEKIIKQVDATSKDYKKIKNAGTTAEGLGWFNLTIGILFAIITDLDGGFEFDYVFVDIVYILIISLIFIKFGKRVKKVSDVRMKDINILLGTTIFVIGINFLSIISSQGEGGFIGFLFILEAIYLFKAKSVLKKTAISF